MTDAVRKALESAREFLAEEIDQRGDNDATYDMPAGDVMREINYALSSLDAGEGVDGRLLSGVLGMSADIGDPCTLKLHFNRSLTDAHRAAVLAAINALSAVPEPPKRDEHAWLIESRASEPCAPDYWAGNGWSKDHNRAIRFCREEDARRECAGWDEDSPLPHEGEHRICEHIWDASLPPMKEGE